MSKGFAEHRKPAVGELQMTKTPGRVPAPGDGKA